MQTLSKQQKLLLSEEIAQTLKMSGPKSSHLSFHFQPQEQQSFSRLGLAIPKKKARRAIDRNRIKRLIREAFRKATIDPVTNVVVKLNRGIGGKTKNRLREKERIAIRGQVDQVFKV